MNFVDFLPQDHQSEFGEIVDRLRKNKTIKSFRTKRMTKYGKTLNIWLTASALTDENGQIVELATTERDLAWLVEE